MRAFEFNRGSPPPNGYQRHHLIPVEVIRHPAFATLFALVSQVGFSPHDFASNGVCLPACERMAIRTGLPLHRGPHPHYTQLVGEQVSVLSRDLTLDGPSVAIALMIRLGHLQGSLRRSLGQANSSLWLNRRDPRHTGRLATFDNDLRQLSMMQFLS